MTFSVRPVAANLSGVSLHPVKPRLAVTPIRFGLNQSLEIALPAYAQRVVHPSFGIEDLQAAFADYQRALGIDQEHSGYNNLSLRRLLWKQLDAETLLTDPTEKEVFRKRLGLDQKQTMSLFTFAKIQLAFNRAQGRYQQSQEEANQYLPEPIQKQLRSYQRSLSGIGDYCFDRPAYLQKVTAIKGPSAVKAIQKWVQSQQSFKRIAEFGKTQLSNGLLQDMAKHADLHWLLKPFVLMVSHPISWFLQWRLQQDIQHIEAYEPMLHRVPFADEAKMRPKAEALLKAYNDAHPEDPIDPTSLQKPSRSGSMAQIYMVKTTQQKQELVLKVFRPDASPAHFESMKSYLYFQNLLRLGTAASSQYQAVEEVEQTVCFQNRELDALHEKQNAEKRQQEYQAVKAIEPVAAKYATTEGLVFERVPGQTLLELAKTTEQKQFTKVLSQVVSQLYSTLLLSPNKPLDLHLGQFMSDIKNTADSKTYWLDHGHEIAVDEAVHKRIMNFIQDLVQLPPNGDRSTLTVKMVEALQKLIPDAKSPWGKYLAACQDRLNKNRVDPEKDKAALKLFYGLIAKPDKKRFQGYFDPLKTSRISLIGVWANYIWLSKKSKNGIGDLPALTAQKPSGEEFGDAFTNFYGMLAPLTQPDLKTLSPDEQQTLDQSIQTLSPEDFTKRFAPYLNPVAYGLAENKYNVLQNVYGFTDSADIAAIQALAQKKLAAVANAVQPLTTGDKKKLASSSQKTQLDQCRRIALAYQHIEAMAKNVGVDFIKHQYPMLRGKNPQMLASNPMAKAPIENLTLLLMQEFTPTVAL